MTSRLRRAGSRLFVDVTPLRRSPGFRWLYAGLALAWFGRQLTVVAVPVHQRTGQLLIRVHRSTDP